MFFSKEADKFLNAGSSKKSHGHEVRAYHAEGSAVEAPEPHKRGKAVRCHRDDGGDVSTPEPHKKGCGVGRRHRADGGDTAEAAHKRGKRVHARSRHADVSDVDAMPSASDAAKAMRHGGKR